MVDDLNFYEKFLDSRIQPHTYLGFSSSVLNSGYFINREMVSIFRNGINI